MMTGQPAAAQRTLNHVQKQFMTAEGDFLPRKHHSLTEVHYLYPNAYFIIGSMIASRYEIAMTGLNFLLGNQDPQHGGFYSLRRHSGEKSPADTISAGAAGLACLATGRIGVARRVADFLAHMIELQPDPKQRFFFTIEGAGKLNTELVDEGRAFFRVIDTNSKNQCLYAMGLPFAFLVRLAEATRESRYRELAHWYFDFQSRCQDPWNNISSGKSGWACAMLYRITGERRYRDIAIYTANNILSMQNPDGSWGSLWKRHFQPGKRGLRNSDFDLTAEFVLWLSVISANIMARDSDSIDKPSINAWRYFTFKSGRWLNKLSSHVFSETRSSSHN
jgi:hypothetical protein